MVKKHQTLFTLSIFFVLLMLTLPGFYSSTVEKNVDNTNLAILFLSQLFVLLSTSVALKNIIISNIIETYSDQLYSFPFELIEKKNFSIKIFQLSSKYLTILVIITGYCLICVFMDIEYRVIYSSMFIVVYYLSINLVPNEFWFFNNCCVIHNKKNNAFYSIKSYRIEGNNCLLVLSDYSKYNVVIENSEAENVVKKFYEAKIVEFIQ